MHNYSSQLALSIKLINTLSSRSFEKGLSKPWVGIVDSENIQVIQEKVTADLQRVRVRFLKFDVSDEIIAYLNHLQKIQKISLKVSEKKGLIQELDLNCYSKLNTFMRDVSIPYKPLGIHQTAQFEFHEMIRAIMDYLLIRTTIANGTGHPGLDEVIKHVLTAKPASFFERGYPGDLFIADHLCIAGGKAGQKYTIRCHKHYLSTHITEGRIAVSADDKYFDFYTVDKLS